MLRCGNRADGTTRRRLLALSAVCLLGVALPALAQTPPQPASTVPPAPLWPMVFGKDGARLIVYQPQIEAWQKFRDLTRRLYNRAYYRGHSGI